MEIKTKLLPLMPLRDIVIFPHMVAPLVVGRTKSIHALEDVMAKGTEIFLVSQRDSNIDDPVPSDLNTIGTFAAVMQLLRLPDGTIKALVEGKRRGQIVSSMDYDKFMMVEVEELFDNDVNVEEIVAYERKVKETFVKYAEKGKKIPKEVLDSVEKIKESDRVADIISAHMPLKSSEKQEIIECKSLIERFAKLLEFINREIDFLSLEKNIDVKVKKRMSEAQRNYFLSEKVKVIHEEMGHGQDVLDDIAELGEKIKKTKMPAYAKKVANKELKKLKNMPPMSSETTVIRNYLDCILTVPWSKKTRGVTSIDKAECVLEEDHYGLKKTKERILEYLAVQIQVKKINGPILCLVGPPGVGKTSICKSIARAMGRKFARLSLGGVHDEAEIRGHRRTYIGAMPGRIIQSLQKVKISNPVFCLDEIDKMSKDFRGDPSSALLEVLDPEQNNTFSDHYLDLDYDLSDVFFITTANSLHSIPGPLLDRMEVIEISGYTEEDKQKIAEGFLVPKQLKSNGFKKGEVKMSSGAILEIVRRYTREAGVRTLERTIASVCRKIALDRLKKKQKKKTYRITHKSIAKFLGVPKYKFGLAGKTNQIGMTTGLAWTSVGGELLQIETTLMPGNGKLIITGKLGEVMKESVQAALSYVRSRALRLGLESGFNKIYDIHVHVPEGAVPKDGPSAGITIATSLVSALLKLPVDRTLAMTGEITLRGRVLPIGGLTEKLLAAKRGDIAKVIIPKENEKDMGEIPKKIWKDLHIDFVENVDDVLIKAIIMPKGELLFKDVGFQGVCGDVAISDHNLAPQ